ncbi:MAG: S1 RNA-binding domain-containing protein [Oscillospiraceae bacterium]|jgi:S1 RNA binding domain protein|nr:S1 RNA-binding domain-containing protein [Oscillospiraceae bacterium]
MENDAIFNGKVTGITKFGAFVALEDGRSGMVHISEIAHSYVNEIRDHLTEGQEVRVKVVGVSPEGRINLSIKKAVPPPPRENYPSRRGAPSGPPTFEDKLKAFMSDSESKISDLRHHSDKHGVRRRK